MKEKKSFRENLSIIIDEEQELTKQTIKALSNIEPEQQTQFENSWADITTARRQEIATKLVEYTEEDVELDFTTVYMFLLKDKDAEVRGTAIDGLWEDETRDYLRELMPLVDNDPSDDVREKAIIALSRFALLASLGKLPERWVNKIHDCLLAQARNLKNSPRMARRAVEGIGYFPNDEAIKDLIMVAYQTDDNLLKASAVVAMGRSVDTRWIPEVGRELSSPEPMLRYEAARAAGEMGSTELVPLLVGLTRDPDSEVRLAAIWSLGQVGGPVAERVLKSLSESESEATREAAKEALAEVIFAQNPLNVLGG